MRAALTDRAPDHLALNRVQALAIGEVDFERMRIAYDGYVLR